MILNILLGLHSLFFVFGVITMTKINSHFTKPIASLSWGGRTGFISLLILLYRLGL